MANKRGPHFNGGRGMNALDKIQMREKAQYDRNMGAQADFLLQIGCDAFLMACADLFDLQPGRAREAVECYRRYIYECMSNMIEDGKDDPETTFFWADLDRRLEQICGKEAFVPKEDRYDVTGERVFNSILAIYAARLKERRKEGEGNGEKLRD